MTPTAADLEDGIVVTSATRSVDETRADLGLEPEPKPDAKANEAAAKPAVEAQAALEQEADSERPDAAVSEAARTLRAGRFDQRVKRLEADNALYEENITLHGGTVPVFTPKAEYKTPAEKIDHLSRRRHELIDLSTKTVRESRTRRPAPIAAEPPPSAPKAGAADEKPAAEPAPTFKFPTYEEYQVQHPDAEYTEYVDARSDARVEWKEGVQRDAQIRTRAREAVKADTEAARVATEAFAQAHPDYHDVLGKVSTDGVHPNLALALRMHLTKAREAAPAILYYLGSHQDEAQSLLTSESPEVFLERFGEIKYAARTSLAAPAPKADAVAEPAKPAPVARPVSGAPTPMAPVTGASTTSRTLQSLADESEDADAYIEERKRASRAS